ncbi:tRNA-splicing endonuclease [Penicillium concentricum]|uniref:tRNA-splicing endonuclease subunit Sen34 n=1 Tax=Penicillium concentricum TaxID=293559 RepID=A0A9W9RCH7_9EURO|nr:tRNA-splicing endonuclease [Penicillium concentricum]KAJ5356344.1 tRNA-splicing endonuclease [Penicillium concentricum]
MDFQPDLPIPISYVSGRYLLFSIDAVTYLRREHHICGVLIGTLPQIPQQNVFLGLPLELMPEEARLLVDKGVACIVDEAKAHEGMNTLLEEDRRRYLRDLESQGMHVSRIQSDRKERNREQTLKKLEEKKAKAKAGAAAAAAAQTSTVPDEGALTPSPKNAAIVDLFNAEDPSSSPSAGSMSAPPQAATAITPATSYPPLSTPPPSTHLSAPAVPPSYPLFAHLHSKGYFLSPGLRFGCQYMAYPGDPLRFHSHFLVVSYDWDQRIDIMDLVVGGRLGTGVKKGFLIGGAQKGIDEVDSEADRVDTVRAFSLEWAGM